MSIKEKIVDFVDSAKGPVLDIVSDLIVPDVATDLVGHVATEAIATTVGELAGVFIPGVGNMILSYKQRRFERNIEILVSELIERQNEFNEYFSKLDDKIAREVKNIYMGIVSDHTIEVTQEEKIKYIVNGYVNLTKDGHPQEDVVMMYYDTLDELSLLDIRVLKLYTQSLSSSEDNIYNVMDDYEFDNSQIDLIKEKISRLGLIENKREGEYNKLFENVKNVMDYLDKAQKGTKNNKFKIQKMTNLKSNELTSYGRKFLRFISRNYEL